MKSGVTKGEVHVGFHSYPPGAEVYLVPKWRWDKDKGLAIRNYPLPEGRTNVNGSLECYTVYVVAFVLKGETIWREIDTAMHTHVEVQFQCA